jgi:hypothetical protein
MWIAVVLVFVACAAPKPEPTLSNRAAPPPGGLLTISENRFGPLSAHSSATLAGLRAAFAGYDVRPTNDSSLSYSVYLNGEKLVWVIPNEDGTLFNVHATSPRIETRGRDWRVGSAFHGARYLTHCECWGDNPTCFRQGDHIALNFQRGCDNLVGDEAREGLRSLEGAVIQRVIWSPTPFRDDSDDEHPDP